MTPEELLKEAGEPVLYAEFAEDGGWLGDASEYQDHLEEPHALYTSDQLAAAVARATNPLEEKLSWLDYTEKMNKALGVEIEELTAQLAAEQLNNKLLRKALEAVIKVHGYESGIPVEAISTQASTEALDAYVAAKVKEAGKFDMWKINPYTKVLETSIKQLTKQRDLAVEALKERLEYAGIIEERCDSIATDKARAAIKESEK